MKKYQDQTWVGVSDKNNDPKVITDAQQEFVGMPIEKALQDEKIADNLQTNRRDFLKYLGFGLGAATIAASCDTPVRKAIPYVTKPDAIVPGVATYYASTYVDGSDYCPVIVKTREGRPIKIEGNSLSSMTEGGTSARTQAYVLSLYDINRLKRPCKIVNGEPVDTDWASIDKEVKGKLNANSSIRILSHTVLSPTAKQAMQDFATAFPNTKMVSYDPVSASALLDATELCFGQRVIPNYHFDKAEVIVSFNADFLGTWISPIEYTAKYIKNRKVTKNNPNQSLHIQLESRMSLTGSNADNRILVKPSEQGAAIVALYNAVASKKGAATVNGPKLSNAGAVNAIKKVATRLIDNKSLVVCGTNNTGEQILVNQINEMLGSYGNTISFGNASMQKQGSDKELQGLIAEMKAGSVDALITFGNANPAYDTASVLGFKDAMTKVKVKISTADSLNETVSVSDYILPNHHGLESWSDAMPKKGFYSLVQPTINPLFDTRQAEISLLTLAGLAPEGDQPMMQYVKKYWETNVFPQQSNFVSFQSFWNNSLSDGVVEFPDMGTATASAADASAAAATVTKPLGAGFEVELYETINIGNGQHANNPWLQEMPDPIARTVWGNYFAVPVKWTGSNFEGLNNVGKRLSYGEYETFDVTVGQTPLNVRGIAQFGQMEDTGSYGLGFGRSVVGRCGNNVGNDVYPWLTKGADGNIQYFAAADVSADTEDHKGIPCVQYHNTIGVTGQSDAAGGEVVNVDEEALVTVGKGFQGALTERSILYSGRSGKEGLKELEEFVQEKRSSAKHLNDATLYPFDERMEDFYGVGHHWAMHVDMTACTGCGACTVACMAENNIPVVGATEVSRHHEMTWLRIDRYFYGDAANPNVAYQPMMCQHCDNAPCENVCPVNATNHSSEGLNQMAYNRCVGTRYCANNCPYKVRRFNWLDYTSADVFGGNQNSINGEEPAFYTDNLTRMVLNPDVTVRSRGVIEKCSFCAQRLQEGKLNAKMEGRPLRDADVKTACQTACPSGAIVFGDQNNKEGELSQKVKSPYTYRVLEEVNVQSSVFYNARINNRIEDLEA